MSYTCPECGGDDLTLGMNFCPYCGIAVDIHQLAENEIRGFDEGDTANDEDEQLEAAERASATNTLYTTGLLRPVPTVTQGPGCLMFDEDCNEAWLIPQELVGRFRCVSNGDAYGDLEDYILLHDLDEDADDLLDRLKGMFSKYFLGTAHDEPALDMRALPQLANENDTVQYQIGQIVNQYDG